MGEWKGTVCEVYLGGRILEPVPGLVFLASMFNESEIEGVEC